MAHNLEDKISYRIIKIIHIFAYIPYPIILIIGLFDTRDYHWAANNYTWNIQNAFIWLLAFSLIYIGVVEGLYRAIFYILFGKRNK